MTKEPEDKILSFSEFQDPSNEMQKKVQGIVKLHQFIAQSKRSLYLNFIKAGFTKAEALQLIKD